MKIQSTEGFLSLSPIELLELPSLVVLTGINGSGKSQFLAALKQGHIKTDLRGPIDAKRVQPVETLLINGRNLADLPTSEPALDTPSSRPLDIERIGDAAIHQQLLAPAWQKLMEAIGDRSTSIDTPPWAVWNAGPDALIDRLALKGEQTVEVRSAFELAERALGTAIGDHSLDLVREIAQVSKSLGISRLSVSPQHLTDLYSYAQFSAFSPNVPRVFLAYRDARHRNDVAYARDKWSGCRSHLEPEEFEARFGPPPWEPINQMLQDFGLNYRVVPPSPDVERPVELQLQRLDNSAEIRLQQLSSGETVLLRFALSLFQFDPLRVHVGTPDLLLLDEMDASLHPEMVNRWLNAIGHLVEKRGITCVLTTHSPTTVALAPENSLYEIRPGVPPRRVTKQQAMNRLTFGVPTLAIDYSGRRQVFAESDSDATVYEKLAAILKGHIELQRTLSFLSTGVRSRNNQEEGTGCEAVKHVVSQLSADGSHSVFGLVDWDRKNDPEGRVFVVGHNSHYALDNLLLHPVLVGALLLRDGVTLSGFDGTFASLGRMCAGQLQKLADAVVAPLDYPCPDKEAVLDPLLGSAEISVPVAHKIMNGHALENLLLLTHPKLKMWARRRGELNETIVTRVLVDHPLLCPKLLADTFLEIANAEID